MQNNQFTASNQGGWWNGKMVPEGRCFIFSE